MTQETFYRKNIYEYGKNFTPSSSDNYTKEVIDESFIAMVIFSTTSVILPNITI